MARPKKYLLWVCAASTWILSSCNTDARPDYEILHIEGVTWACNISTSYALFGSTYEIEEEWEVRLPASDGDLLYMVNDQDLELYYRYSSQDGHHLVISRDTIKPDLAFINGRLCQIEISDGASFQRLTRQLSAPLEKPVSRLYIRDTLTDEMILELQQLESSLRGAGIMLEHSIGAKQFNELLSVCRPNWLGLESFPVLSETEPGMFFEDLELLWITGDLLALSRKVQCCKNLESLIIADWDPGNGELVPLSSLNKLHTLTLAGCGITDFGEIDFPGTLLRLHLVECDTLTDISGLTQIPDLISLGLAGSNDVASLESIGHLKQLRRVAFPENISQEEFASIVGQLNSLEIIELINCPGIKDLSALQEKKNLEVLILQLDQAWPEQLGSLDQLEFMVLNSELFEEAPERIAELRSKLPNTTIVPGSGLCLGSGWLLLLVPLIIKKVRLN